MTIDWPDDHTVWLTQHMSLMKLLIEEARQQGMESGWYHVYDHALNFTAGRISKDKRWVSVYPQANLRVAARNPVQDVEPSDRITRAMATMRLRDGHDTAFERLPDTDTGPSSSSAEESDIPTSDFDGSLPHDPFRTPDFITIITVFGAQFSYHSLGLIHEIKPEGYSNPGSKFLSRFLVEQIFKQAQLAFVNYPHQDFLYSMTFEGLKMHLGTFSRAQLPPFDARARLTISDMLAVCDIRTFKDVFQSDMLDYTQSYKKFWEQAMHGYYDVGAELAQPQPLV